VSLYVVASQVAKDTILQEEEPHEMIAAVHPFA
jgi:hypothetical protein